VTSVVIKRERERKQSDNIKTKRETRKREKKIEKKGGNYYLLLIRIGNEVLIERNGYSWLDNEPKNHYRGSDLLTIAQQTEMQSYFPYYRAKSKHLLKCASLSPSLVIERELEPYY
jgi:hypothetical protein